MVQTMEFCSQVTGTSSTSVNIDMFNQKNGNNPTPSLSLLHKCMGLNHILETTTARQLHGLSDSHIGVKSVVQQLAERSCSRRLIMTVYPCNTLESRA